MPCARLTISTPLVCTSRWYVSIRSMRVRLSHPSFGVDFVQRARNTRLKPVASLAFSKEPNSARFASGTADEMFSSRSPIQFHRARRFSCRATTVRYLERAPECNSQNAGPDGWVQADLVCTRGKILVTSRVPFSVASVRVYAELCERFRRRRHGFLQRMRYSSRRRSSVLHILRQTDGCTSSRCRSGQRCRRRRTG